jgi:hypothetical protein
MLLELSISFEAIAPLLNHKQVVTAQSFAYVPCSKSELYPLRVGVIVLMLVPIHLSTEIIKYM